MSRLVFPRAAALIFLTALAGCGGRGPEPARPAATTKPSAVERHIVDRPPAVSQLLGVVFGDQLELVGINVPNQVKKGESFELEQVWRCLRVPERDWRIAVHFRGPTPKAKLNRDQAPPVPTTQWQEGRYIHWKVQAAVPAKAPLGDYTIEIRPYVIVPKTKPPKFERLEVTSEGSGRLGKMKLVAAG